MERCFFDFSILRLLALSDDDIIVVLYGNSSIFNTIDPVFLFPVLPEIGEDIVVASLPPVCWYHTHTHTHTRTVSDLLSERKKTSGTLS